MPNTYKSEVTRAEFAQIPEVIKKAQKVDGIERRVAEVESVVSQQKEDIADLMDKVGGGTTNVSDALKVILQRIQFEIKACIRDDSVCPNSYIDATDVLINNLASGTDKPSEPDDEPSEPVGGSLSVSWSGTTATVSNLKNMTVSYSGTTATIGA